MENGNYSEIIIYTGILLLILFIILLPIQFVTKMQKSN